jgi:heme exporter protein D
MIWSSWSDFLAMGGYGRYVWGSFAAVLLALAGEQVALALRWRAARRLARNTAHDAAQNAARPRAGAPGRRS